MKNYVVWHNCKINETQSRFNIELAGRDEVTAAYDRMWQISHATAQQFLAGEWTAIVCRETADNRAKMLHDQWFRIYDLWRSETCNLLALDNDTMFIRPTEMFGRFAEFRLFNWTDAKSIDEFENFYNSGIRYFPATMSQDIWNLGLELAKNHWDLDIYDQDQRIYNSMFWAQNVPDPHHPDLAWQGQYLIGSHFQNIPFHEEFNQCSLDKAHILHLHSTKGAEYKAAAMASLCRQLGLQI